MTLHSRLLHTVTILCVSVRSRISIETDERIEVVLACRLLWTVFKEIQVTTKIRVLPSGTLAQTPDLENFPSVYDRRNALSTIRLGRRSKDAAIGVILGGGTRVQYCTPLLSVKEAIF